MENPFENAVDLFDSGNSPPVPFIDDAPIETEAQRSLSVILGWPQTCSDDIIDHAVTTSIKGHMAKREVNRFLKDRKSNVVGVRETILDGSFVDGIRFKKLDKTNPDGKVRHIDSPDFYTRILEHAFINIIRPIYETLDNGVGLNCKPGCGITAKHRDKSVVKRLKHIFYDRRDLHYAVVLDQRKCYEHIREKVFRAELQWLIREYGRRNGIEVASLKAFVNFAVRVSFTPDHRLPIGTPSSPLVHHIVMLRFDRWVQGSFGPVVSYADDNVIFTHELADAHQAKWRTLNYWWYNLGLRAKKGTLRIIPIDRVPLDFCGYVFYRNVSEFSKNAYKKHENAYKNHENTYKSTIPAHSWEGSNNNIINPASRNKGYTLPRRRTIQRLERSARKMYPVNDRSLASRLSILAHSDCYQRIKNILSDMKFSDFTASTKLTKKGPYNVRCIKMAEIVGRPFTILHATKRYNKSGACNWIALLVVVRGNDRESSQPYVIHIKEGYELLFEYALTFLDAQGCDFFDDPVDGVKIIMDGTNYIFEDSIGYDDNIDTDADYAALRDRVRSYANM